MSARNPLHARRPLRGVLFGMAAAVLVTNTRRAGTQLLATQRSPAVQSAWLAQLVVHEEVEPVQR